MPKQIQPHSVSDDDQSFNDDGTAAILRISKKTLQRMDARGEGPDYFWAGHRKRRNDPDNMADVDAAFR